MGFSHLMGGLQPPTGWHLARLGGLLGPLASGLWPPNVALQTPWILAQEVFSESFMKLRLNLAEILSIHKQCFVFLFESSLDTHSKISRKFRKDWT